MLAFCWQGCVLIELKDIHPISMTQMEKIFSELVLGETFPKPTLVRELKVK